MNVFVLNTKEDILKNEGNSSILSPTIEVNGAPKQPDYKLSSEYLPLCSEQTHSYRFGTTWGWVNDNSILIFVCTVSLRLVLCFRVSFGPSWELHYSVCTLIRSLFHLSATWSVSRQTVDTRRGFAQRTLILSSNICNARTHKGAGLEIKCFI